MEPILFCWSGGKDSAQALYEVMRNKRYMVVALLTTVTREYDRVSMHGIRRELALKQAGALGIPLEIVWITPGASNDEYERSMAAMLTKYHDKGVRVVAFGDVFLEDLKKYREDKLAQVGMTAIFPIWKVSTDRLARQFIARGFHAIITCVDTQKLDARFSGREFDLSFLSDLPAEIDPCGENGEFHSFVYAGPIFSTPIPVVRGECVLRDGRFQYCDLRENHE